MVTVKRALLSCHDKTGLDEFAAALAQLGVELVASGGTAEFLTKRGLRVTTVETFAGIAEQLDGRVKTLHPKIHGGILARRDDTAHVQAVGAEGLIDLVVVNLYPFQQAIQRPQVSLPEAIEQIDIGGVALLRAAAKNFAHVGAVSDSAQYAPVAEALQRGQGRLPEALAKQLAVSAFQLTSAYDTLISRYLASTNGPTPSSTEREADALPDEVSLTLRRRQPLRYGENPHQRGGWYVETGASAWGLGTLCQHQGKELSYNNLLDIDAALRCLLEFEEPTCAIIKHHSQCGLAGGIGIREAYEQAHACDPESAFGGIVGFNRPLDGATAYQLTGTFLEVIVAPSVDDQAVRVFGSKSNLRVVTLTWPAPRPAGWAWRQLLGGWALQEFDARAEEPGAFQVATRRAPTARERADLLFAWKAAKHALSNGIVIASSLATRGIGQGQPSRVGSVRLAIEKAGSRSRNAVAASDGFFPFPDSIELLAKAGITAVIQPGGSIRDREVISAADDARMSMLLTSTRHFRH